MRLILPISVFVVACQPTGTSTIPLGSPLDGPTQTSETNYPNLPGELSVYDGELVAPDKRIGVTLGAPGVAWAACTLDATPTETVIAESMEPALEHELKLLGLAAGESYDCEVHGGAETWDLQLEVDPVFGAPAFEVTRDESVDFQGAWTLLNDGGGCFSGMNRVIVVDPEGRHRWVYEAGNDMIADLDTSVTSDGYMHVGGGWGVLDASQPNRGIFRTLDWDGTILVDRTEPDFGEGFNHHSEPMEDGSYLNVTTSRLNDGVHEWYGVGIERWHPEEGVVWTWDTDAMLDAGQLSWVAGDDSPYHANSVTWMDDEEGPALYVSLFVDQEIWRIDRDTGLRTWRFGPGGDFTYLDTDGTLLPSSRWVYAQHDPEYSEDGRVLVYDNGYDRPGTDYSRVAEFQLDKVDMTATLLWEWTEDDWNNPIVGDADWLDNGNVLVTKGFFKCWSPTSPDTSAIVELDPDTLDVGWRLKWVSRDKATFRAQRYEGCDIFSNNTRFCDEAEDRLNELRAL